MFDLRGYIETVWGNGDLAAVDRFVSADCVFRDVSGNTRIAGLDELVSNLRQWHDVFENPRVEVRRVMKDRSSPTIIWDWTLTARPAIYRNNAGDRADVSVYGISVATVIDGKIVEEINCTDMKEFIDLVNGSRE